jgi:urease accessory protein
MGLSALLLLADSRLPTGAHAHSGGVEAAVAAGQIHDIDTLDGFLRGRLATAGLVGAAVTAMTVRRLSALQARAPYGTESDRKVPLLALTEEMDGAVDARTPSAALRRASRAQGRALLRAGRALWVVPDTVDSPHQPVALGLLAASAGVGPREAATVAAYTSVAGPATAAVRLLGLDPYAVHARLARLAPEQDEVAERACSTMDGEPDDLPAAAAPRLDITAEHHATWEVRLFAS